MDGWRDIVSIAVDSPHTVGLKSDGTAVAVDHNCHDRCSVSDWTGIIAVTMCGVHTVGLHSDSTVVAVGDNECGQCNVGRWSGVKVREIG